MQGIQEQIRGAAACGDKIQLAQLLNSRDTRQDSVDQVFRFFFKQLDSDLYSLKKISERGGVVYCRRSMWHSVRLLIEAGAVFKASREVYSKFLLQACHEYYLDAFPDLSMIIKWLIENGADVNAQGYNECNALSRIVRWFEEHSRAQWTVEGNDAADALDLAKFLIDRGARVDFTPLGTKENVFKKPPIYSAAGINSPQFVKMLVAAGAKLQHQLTDNTIVSPIDDAISALNWTPERINNNVLKTLITLGAYISEKYDFFTEGHPRTKPLLDAGRALRSAQSHLIALEFDKFKQAFTLSYQLWPDLICDYFIELFRLNSEEPYQLNIYDPFSAQQKQILIEEMLVLPATPELIKARQLLSMSFLTRAKLQLKQISNSDDLSAALSLFVKCYRCDSHLFCRYILALFDFSYEDGQAYSLTTEDQFTFEQRRTLLKFIFEMPYSPALKNLCVTLGERLYVQGDYAMSYYFFEKAGGDESDQTPSTKLWQNRCCLAVAGVDLAPGEDINEKIKTVIQNEVLYKKLLIKLALTKNYFFNMEYIFDTAVVEKDMAMFIDANNPHQCGLMRLVIAEFIFQCITALQQQNPFIVGKKILLQGLRNYIEQNKAELELFREEYENLLSQIETLLTPKVAVAASRLGHFKTSLADGDVAPRPSCGNG